ncbi:MAG: hypothetical protein ACOCVN_03035 [bacterium]
MRLFIYIIFLSSIILSVGYSQSNNTQKSERYYNMVNAKDKGNEVEPYVIENLNTFLEKNPDYKSQLNAIESFVNEVDSLIFSIITDNYLDTVMTYSKGCFELEATPKYYQGYATYKAKVNKLRDYAQKLIKNESDLIRTDFYTSEREFFFLRESFYFKDAFQPKNIDFYRYRNNPMGQCVLCYNKNGIPFKGKVKDKPTKYIGFFQSKYLFLVNYPVIYDGVYLCDIKFEYLK